MGGRRRAGLRIGADETQPLSWCWTGQEEDESQRKVEGGHLLGVAFTHSEE